MWTLKTSPFYLPLYPTTESPSIYWTNVKVDKEKKEITQLMNVVSCKDFILDYFYRTYDGQHANYKTVPNEDHWILIGLNPSLSAEKAKETILAYMNEYEQKHGFDLTEVYTDIGGDGTKDRTLLVKIPKDWWKDNLTIVSIYLSNLRMLITNGHNKFKDLTFKCNEQTYYNLYSRSIIQTIDKSKVELYQTIQEFLQLVHNDPLSILKYYDPNKFDYRGYPKTQIASNVHGMCGIFWMIQEHLYHYYINLKHMPFSELALSDYKKAKVEEKQKQIKETLELAAKKPVVKKTTTGIKKKKVTTDVKVQGVQRTTKRPRTTKTA